MLASTTSPNDPAIQTAWGELLLEKYNRTDAMKSFQIALQADPRWAPALLGSARALADENPAAGGEPRAQGARRSTRRRSMRRCSSPARPPTPATTTRRAKRWRRRSPSTRPASTRTRCVAALAYVEDKPQEFEAEVAKTLAIAPNYGDVYRTAGELAAHNYRFDEAVTLTRRALSLDPKNPRTLADLGTHLLRTGDEPARADRARGVVQDRSLQQVTFNLLG